ncbi:hypothetical protein N7461_000616 [Penicillium sp. DV-2018c]|nr:hypothetical protein N7461_000616 [Penicillium sp. DV-2018c]
MTNERFLVLLSKCRTIVDRQWTLYVDALPSLDQRNEARTTWTIFEDWTLSLFVNPDDVQVHVTELLHEKVQGEHQDPMSFDYELAVLERLLGSESKSQSERALNFWVRLTPEIKNNIRIHCLKMPDNRAEMVRLAMHFWEAARRRSTHNEKKRQQTDDNKQSEKPRKYRGRGRRHFPSRKRGRNQKKSC